MKVWITKYALTTGIYEQEGYESGDGYFRGEKCYSLFCKNEWHKTKEDAIVHAENKRDLKLKSLERQMKKISALKF